MLNSVLPTINPHTGLLDDDAEKYFRWSYYEGADGVGGDGSGADDTGSVDNAGNDTGAAPGPSGGDEDFGGAFGGDGGFWGQPTTTNYYERQLTQAEQDLIDAQAKELELQNQINEMNYEGAEYIQGYLEGQVENPQLADGADFQYTEMEAQADEFLDPNAAYAGVTSQFDRATALADTQQAEASVPDYMSAGDAAQADVQYAEGVTADGMTADYQAAQAYTVSDQDLADLLEITPATYTAFTINGAQGVVDPRQLLTYQLEQLYSDVNGMNMEAGNVPAWASGAIRYADGLMNKRGLGASSMAGAAISQAIMEVAVPIAQYDADQYGNMNLQNLRNRQEAYLSNQSAINASRQFNAQSTNEINMFMKQLRDGIIKFNVQQLNAMSQFNASEFNKVSMYNAGEWNALAKFNAAELNKLAALNATEYNKQMQFNALEQNRMFQFNASEFNKYSQFTAEQLNQVELANMSEANKMALANAQAFNAMKQFQDQLQAQQERFMNENMLKIQAANAEWRRALNLANTAGINYENQVRAQNLFNLSTDAIDKMWQANRDLFYWANVTSENDEDRALRLSIAQMQQADYNAATDAASSNALGQTLGGLAGQIIGKFF